MAAALTLGLRGHRVVVLEAAPKVRRVIIIMFGS
jgi:2-polyprenyl-6-methoxyphenol hydroxylase-like FAD-dependent oxidoreductase